MKTAAIVQARSSSTRLPGKVLKELPFGSGITVLQQVIRRLRKSRRLDDIIIATTTDKSDEEIIRLSEKENVKWFKGSMDDVLERYYLAAKENGLDTVVRVTSDCPCIDPEIIDILIDEHITVKADYTWNALPRTFPHGFDAEVFGFDILEKIHKQAKQAFEREHVCPYVRSNPQMFKINSVKASERFHAPDIRVTIDTESDYILLCAVFDYLYAKNNFFSAEDIIRLFDSKPWLKAINKDAVDKK